MHVDALFGYDDGSSIDIEILTERLLQVPDVSFVRFAMAFYDRDAWQFRLLQAMQRFRERVFQLLDTIVQILLAAEAAGVLEQRHYRSSAFV